MSKEAMKLALEALEEAHHRIEHKQDVTLREEAITALRKALAEPAQRRPLTLPQIAKALADGGLVPESFNEDAPVEAVVRAIEAKLREKNT